MFSGERTKTIFPAPSGEDGALADGRLTVEIKFCRPPAFDSVFEFECVGDKSTAALGRAADGLAFDFEVAGFFQLVRVGDEISFLCAGRGANQEEERKSRQPVEQGLAKHGRILVLVVIENEFQFQLGV